MKVYLHIGTYKTGSTALQSCMTLNRSELLEKGVYWGEYSLLSNSHSNIAYGLLRDALIKEELFFDYKQHPRFKNLADAPRKVIEDVVKNAERNNCNTVIISNEAMFADAFRTLCGLQTLYNQEIYDKINADMRQAFFDILKEYFDEIAIVCYLRRQDFFLESQYNQFCKQPWYGSECKCIEFEEFVRYKPLSLDYQKELIGWQRIFNESKMIIRPYEKLNKDIIFDFFGVILNWKEEEIERLKKINKSGANIRWHRDLVEYKKSIGIEDKKLNRTLNEYAEQTERIKDYAYFSSEGRKKFLLIYEECNSNISKIYFDGNEFFDTSMEIEEYKGISYDKFQEITRYVMKRLVTV